MNMATARGPNSSPYHPHSVTQQNNPSSGLHNLPTEYSKEQREAKAILTHLLSKLKSNDSGYYERYGNWVERHPNLEDLCFQCVRPQVWAFLRGRWSLDSLKTIGGDLKFEGRSVYMNGVLGLDKRVRIYIGQATSLRQRVAQHLNFRYRRDNPSLHYHAMQQSIYNTIGALAILPSPSSGNNQPGMDCPNLLLNVLEMWMCLVFRSLSKFTLETWLNGIEGIDSGKRKGKEGEFGGLNIASPLDHGDKLREWVEFNESDDPIILEYLKSTSRSSQRLGSGIRMEAQLTSKEQASEATLDDPAKRRKEYAESAKKYRSQQDKVLPLPRWVFFSGLALALGVVLFTGRRGPQLKYGVRYR